MCGPRVRSRCCVTAVEAVGPAWALGAGGAVSVWRRTDSLGLWPHPPLPGLGQSTWAEGTSEEDAGLPGTEHTVDGKTASGRVLLEWATSSWATPDRGVGGRPGHLASSLAQKRECVFPPELTAPLVTRGARPAPSRAQRVWPSPPPASLASPPLSLRPVPLGTTVGAPHPPLCSTHSPLIPEARACLALHREGKTTLKNAGPRCLVSPAQICPRKTCRPGPGGAGLSVSPGSPRWAAGPSAWQACIASQV